MYNVMLLTHTLANCYLGNFMRKKKYKYNKKRRRSILQIDSAIYAVGWEIMWRKEGTVG